MTDAAVFDANPLRAAQRLGLRVTGTVGVLLMAKQHGLIESVRPLLDALLAQEFRLSLDVYDHALRLASETM